MQHKLCGVPPPEVGHSAGGPVGVQLALQPARAGQQLLQVVQAPGSHQVVAHVLQEHGKRSSFRRERPMHRISSIIAALHHASGQNSGRAGAQMLQLCRV